MGGAHSKRKGSKWEREISAILEEAFDLPFNRTLSSGAWTGGKNAHRKKTASKSMIDASLGDIVTPENWNFVIEAKAYKDLDFHNILLGHCAKMSGWLDEVLFDSEGENNNCIIFKIDRKGTYMALPFVVEYIQPFADNEVTYTMYNHYYGDDLKQYILFDFKILSGVYDAEYPEMKKTVKDYILHLAEIKENN